MLLCVQVVRSHLINHLLVCVCACVCLLGGRWLQLTVITGSGDRKPELGSVAVNWRAAGGFRSTKHKNSEHETFINHSNASILALCSVPNVQGQSKVSHFSSLLN